MASAVNADTFAGDEIRIDEKEHRLGDFLGSAPFCKGSRFEYASIFFRG
jgi:hypothetical protein